MSLVHEPWGSKNVDILLQVLRESFASRLKYFAWHSSFGNKDSNIMHVLNKCQELQHLALTTIYNNNVKSNVLLPKLRILHLYTDYTIDNDIEFLLTFSMPALAHLKITRVGRKGNNDQLLFKTHGSSLVSLDIGVCRVDCQPFVDHCPLLKILRFNSRSWYFNSLAHPTLEDVVIDVVHLGSEAFHPHHTFMAVCFHIRRFQRCPSLKAIHIHGFRDDSYFQILSSMGSNHRRAWNNTNRTLKNQEVNLCYQCKNDFTVFKSIAY